MLARFEICYSFPQTDSCTFVLGSTFQSLGCIFPFIRMSGMHAPNGKSVLKLTGVQHLGIGSAWNVYKSELKLTFLGNRTEQRICLYGTATLRKTPPGLFPTRERRLFNW